MPQDGYPTEDELTKLRDWPFEDSRGALEYMHEIWWMPDWGVHFDEEKGLAFFSTGGWSGNEDIIANLPMMFGPKCLNSRTGGHYTFELDAEKAARYCPCCGEERKDAR